MIKNTENFAFIAVLVFKLLYFKFFFINRKDNRNCKEVGYFLIKLQISRVNYCRSRGPKFVRRLPVTFDSQL